MKKTDKNKKANTSFKALFGERRKAALYGFIDVLLFYGAFSLAYFFFSGVWSKIVLIAVR